MVLVYTKRIKHLSIMDNFWMIFILVIVTQLRTLIEQHRILAYSTLITKGVFPSQTIIAEKGISVSG